MNELYKKIFWLHIKKCGGTSFRQTFKDYYVITEKSNVRPFIALPKEEWNDALNNFALPLGEYDNKRMLFAKKFLYSKDEFNKMFKFTIIRNPYDRAVSNWKYLLKNQKLICRKTLYNPKKTIMKYSFEKFLEEIPNISKNHDRHFYTHVLPYYPDITDESGNILLDYVFKLENIDEFIEKISKILNVNNISFEHHKKNRETSEYRHYYNKKSKRLVEELYEQDIESFKYVF
jgi:hypothetical protein